MFFLQNSYQRGLFKILGAVGRFAASSWPWPVRCQLGSGQTMYVDLRSTIGRGIFARGEFDPGVFAPFVSILRKGDAFVDIGANVGYYTMCALDCIGPSGTVHAFEIDERPLKCLRKTLRHLSLTNVHLNEVAVGDRHGFAQLVMKAECGNSEVQTDECRGGLKVPMTTLDDWYEDMGCPNVRAIKIDVEGGEHAVLTHAQKLLSARKPTIVSEAWDGRDPAQSRVALLLRSLGYSVESLPNVFSPTILATHPGGSL